MCLISLYFALLYPTDIAFLTKCTGTIFPTTSVHFVFLYCILTIFTIFVFIIMPVGEKPTANMYSVVVSEKLFL